MAERLFPDRKRCRRCRSALGTLVLDRLYCSYHCVGVGDPGPDPLAAPRWCRRTTRTGRWVFKARYSHPGAVPEHLTRSPATNVYHCGWCREFHTGHSRVRDATPAEPGSTSRMRGGLLSRRVRDGVELGSVVERLRVARGLTRPELAALLGVRPIRLRELEEGAPVASAGLALRVLAELRVDVDLRERAPTR